MDRAKSFRNWMLLHFTKDELRDIAGYGAESGWLGLTYYSETVLLYKRFKGEIWTALIADTVDQGYRNPFELIATFKWANSIGNVDQVENLLVWYMAERTALALTEERH